jgi:Mu transposase, C-terminal
MKDYRLRIGMRFAQQGREFVIEGPLPDDQLKIKDTFTDVCSARTTADLLEDLFAGRLELIGEGKEGQVLRDALAQRRVSDLTVLDDGNPLKVEALRRLHYVQAVFDERPRVRTRETLSPIIERISEQIKDENPPAWTTLKRWSRIYERSGEDVRALVPAIKARGNRQAKYSGRIVETFSAEDQQKAKEVAQIVDETIRVKYLRLERPSVSQQELQSGLRTDDACLELVHLWIVDVYHQTVHRGIRDIPHRRWVENIQKSPPNLPPRSADLKVLIGFNADRAIGPSGIELFTLRYNSPELATLRLNLKKGEKVALKYDPQDISIIYVYDRFEDRTIEVPALNQEYTRKLTIWQHHVIRKYARRAVQDCVDIEALCRAKEKIQQIVERERFLTGNMRGKQKIAHYLDLGQKISDSAPGEGETGGMILPDSASMRPLEAKEDAKETNPLTDQPPSQANPSSSREPGGQKKPARNSVSSKGSAQLGSPQNLV